MYEALKGAAGNMRVKGGVVLLNTEFMEKEDLESIPCVAESLLGMNGVSTAVVYGVSGDALYVFAKSRDSQNLERLLSKAFSNIGQVRAANGAVLAKVSLGLIGLLKNNAAILKTLENAMCDALLGGVESDGMDRIGSIARLKGIKSLIQGRERKAVAW